jgi:NAD(P)-dependent dehydrogenase (short-subunit alcohol dehydrogenase family)
MSSKGRLNDKVAIVTGGAGGIGAATVRLFVREDAKVIVADIDDERGKRLEDELEGKTRFLHVDVTKESDVGEAVKTAVDSFGRLDIMFNNAGIVGAVGPIEEVTVEAFEKTVAVHLRGVFLGIKKAAPVMRKLGSGSIINTASTAAISSGFGNHIYSACKAGIVQLTRTVSTELGESGIRVNCISPGYIPTPMIGIARSLTRKEAEAKLHVIEEAFRDVQPLPGPLMPEDIAKAALFLASDDSRFVTGVNLLVDGGVSVGRMWRDYQKGAQNLKEALGKD